MPKRQNRRHPHPDATPLAQDRQQNQPTELIMKIKRQFHNIFFWNKNSVMAILMEEPIIGGISEVSLRNK
ncbi:hypothetical protein G6L28_20005 [Agrobacterium larrymoorei]|nr:hypothetical protein [Agrobacterium larrymoorei]